MLSVSWGHQHLWGCAATAAVWGSSEVLNEKNREGGICVWLFSWLSPPLTSAFFPTSTSTSRGGTLWGYRTGDSPDGNKKGECRDNEITPQISEMYFKEHESGFAGEVHRMGLFKKFPSKMFSSLAQFQSELSFLLGG